MTYKTQLWDITSQLQKIVFFKKESSFLKYFYCDAEVDFNIQHNMKIPLCVVEKEDSINSKLPFYHRHPASQFQQRNYVA